MLLVTACAGSRASSIVQHAAEDSLVCAEVVLSPQDDSYLARGCGRWAVYSCRESHCANLSNLAWRQGEQALNCPRTKLRQTQPRRFEVSGCGKAMSYRCALADDLPECQQISD